MAISVILFLLLSASVFGLFKQARRYDELQRLGNPCYPRNTCQSLNGATEDHLWGNRTCECGEHCIRHQTCCIDSSYFGMEHDAPSHSKETCQKVQTRRYSVLMVSSCLPEWQNSYIDDKCVHPENKLKDPLSEVPVTSSQTRTTYKNFFCALCNNDADSSVIWDIEAKSLKDLDLDTDMPKDLISERLVYNAGQNSWGVFYLDPETKRERFKRIEIRFALRKELQDIVKPCHSRIVSECKSSYKSTRLRYKCQAYYSPVKGRRNGSREFVVYKNMHCAVCNGLRADVDDFVCPSQDNGRRFASVSFTKLLDVNRNDGELVGKTSVCKEGQVYDRFFKKCRSLVCVMPNHIVKNGACVKSD